MHRTFPAKCSRASLVRLTRAHSAPSKFLRGPSALYGGLLLVDSPLGRLDRRCFCVTSMRRRVRFVTCSVPLAWSVIPRS